VYQEFGCDDEWDEREYLPLGWGVGVYQEFGCDDEC